MFVYLLTTNTEKLYLKKKEKKQNVIFKKTAVDSRCNEPPI